MSLHYILDGYNIIKQLPSQNNKKLKSSRNALVYFIEQRHPQGSRRNKVSIVFDGREDVLPYREDSSAEIIFAKGESADDRIKKMVEKSNNPKQIVVVTDDREIKFFVRHCGATVMKVAEFLAQGKTKTSDKDSGDEKHIPAEVQYHINEELKRIWLK